MVAAILEILGVGKTNLALENVLTSMAQHHARCVELGGILFAKTKKESWRTRL